MLISSEGNGASGYENYHMFLILVYIHQPVLHHLNYFSDVELEYQLIFCLMLTSKDNDEIFSIIEFTKKLNDLHELANESMTTRQVKAIRYHDKNVLNDVITFIYQETKGKK